jgi:uncharacterized protein YycO
MRAGALLAACLALLATSCRAGESYSPRNADILFQTSRSSQSTAIQRATHSPYSHMGVVYIRGGRPLVLEAVEPVRLTPLDAWVARGEGGHFVVKRLRQADAILTPAALARMLEVGRSFEGKHYDVYFEWSDERIYCSELVWKLFERALGLELGRLEALSDFDLSDPLVHTMVWKRWGGPPPAAEPVISPAAIYSSELLVTVSR